MAEIKEFMRPYFEEIEMIPRKCLKRWICFCFILILFLSLYDAASAPAGESGVNRFSIGCILPLTGQYAPYGNRALEAIKLATGASDPAGTGSIKLIIEDSQSRPEVARKAVIRLANHKDIVCILGPLGGNESFEAAKEAQKLKVPILTLTQREGITDVGDYIFRHFLTGRVQMKALVQYAIEDMGLRRFAVLYPDDHYGNEMVNLFRNEVLNRGGTVIKVKSYAETQTDFGNEIKMITGMAITRDENSGNTEEVYKPVIDFDALFIPDSYVRISMIAPQLAYYNVKGVKLLGTSGWNSPELLKMSGEYLEGAIFVDGFSKNSFYSETQDFIDFYYATYNKEPEMMEAIAYDAAGIVVKIIKENRFETRGQFRNRLLQLRDFPGATGKTSFSGTRDAQKDVFILMVRDGDVKQVK